MYQFIIQTSLFADICLTDCHWRYGWHWSMFFCCVTSIWRKLKGRVWDQWHPVVQRTIAIGTNRDLSLDTFRIKGHSKLTVDASGDTPYFFLDNTTLWTTNLSWQQQEESWLMLAVSSQCPKLTADEGCTELHYDVLKLFGKNEYCAKVSDNIIMLYPNVISVNVCFWWETCISQSVHPQLNLF